jgi:hypothetical protein
MHSGKFVLAQLLDWIHPQQFQRCVTRYGGDYKVRRFSCWDQFLCLAFAQLTYRESLRDIEACLRSRRPQLYHLGLRGEVSRATLADANEARDWRIYADLAHGLIRQARQLYAHDDLGVELEQAAYALDATTIDLCLSLFPWARFRRSKGAVKMHTLLDVRGSIPTTVSVSDGRTHEVNWLDQLAFEANAIYIMDRGYLDFARLHTIEQAQAFFVIRAKERLNYCRLHSHPVATDTGSNHFVDRLLFASIVSRQTPAGAFLRRGAGTGAGLFDQSLRLARTDGVAPLLPALARGVVFQMDQAASADQSVLWHVAQRGAHATVDRSGRLRVGGDRPQATQN